MFEKPVTQLCYAEEEDLLALAQALLESAVIFRGSESHQNLSKVDRIRHIDAIFDDRFLLDQLYRAGNIPHLADHVELDRLS